VLVGGPDMAPQPPNVRTGPGTRGAPLSCWGPDMAPKPPTFGPARETRGAPLFLLGAPIWPPNPRLQRAPGNPWRSSILLLAWFDQSARTSHQTRAPVRTITMNSIRLRAT